MKFPTKFGVREIVGDQVTARKCYLLTVLPKERHVNDTSVNQVLKINIKDTLEIPITSN